MSISIELSGMVVLVTGGTRGIGRSIVETLLEAGASVAFCAPEAEVCAAVALELSSVDPEVGGRLLAVAADLSNPATLENFVAQTQAKFGKVDAMICNGADLGVATSIDEVDLDRYRRLLDVNVVGNFRLCQLVLPHMVERQQGSITMVTSIAGHSAFPANIPYSSSKAALTSMAKSLAAQYASDGVRVNCVSPGLIKTEASRFIWDGDEAARSYISKMVPMNRIGLPEEIAYACAFLASSLGSYVTGAILPVDGGRMGVGRPAGK